MPAKNEKELLLAYIDGDQEAFNELYCLYENDIREVIWRTAPGYLRSEVDDICQYFWLNIIQYISSYDTGKPVKNWFFASAIKASARYRDTQIRKSKVDILDSKVMTVSEMINPPRSREIRPDDNVATKEECRIVRNALGKLKPLYRDIIYKVHLKGLSLDEYSSTTGLPMETVYKRLQRGMQRLREVREVKLLVGQR